MNVHHTSPASSQAALQPRRSSLNFFDTRAIVDKRLWGVLRAWTELEPPIHAKLGAKARQRPGFKNLKKFAPTSFLR